MIRTDCPVGYPVRTRKCRSGNSGHDTHRVVLIIGEQTRTDENMVEQMPVVRCMVAAWFVIIGSRRACGGIAVKLPHWVKEERIHTVRRTPFSSTRHASGHYSM